MSGRWIVNTYVFSLCALLTIALAETKVRAMRMKFS